MIKTLTMKGFRSMQPMAALPRETQAAAKALSTAEGMADKLVKATTKEQVSDVLSEAFAQSMLDMAIKRDPHVSMYGRIYYLLDTAATAPGDADFFDEERAPGAAGSGVAGVSNNLIVAHKPLKPCLIHNVSVCVYVEADKSSHGSLGFLPAANLSLKRAKDSIFEVPLIHAVQSIVLDDVSHTLGVAYDFEVSEAGGIALEGHGAPFLATEDISFELTWEAGAQLQGVGQGREGMVLLVARIDGETLEV